MVSAIICSAKLRLHLDLIHLLVHVPIIRRVSIWCEVKQFAIRTVGVTIQRLALWHQPYSMKNIFLMLSMPRELELDATDFLRPRLVVLLLYHS